MSFVVAQEAFRKLLLKIKTVNQIYFVLQNEDLANAVNVGASANQQMVMDEAD